MKRKYKISRFKLEDIKLYESIYKSAFSAKPNLNEVKNKFFHKYQKNHPSFIAISESDEPASFYGIITQRVMFNQEEFEIGQSCDSMTHKDHAGQGLFVNVAETAYDYLKTQNINFIYGFPNSTIYNLRKIKLKWEHHENVNVYKQKINTLPIDKLVKKIPLLKVIYLSYLKLIFSKYKSSKTFFDNSVIKKNVGGVIHDLNYFEYKKSANKFILKINNINFWIKIDGILWVGDFENTDLQNFTIAFDLLKKLAVKAGVSNIIFHYQEGTTNNELLQHTLKAYSIMPVGYRNLTDKHKEKTFKFSGSDFDTW